MKTASCGILGRDKYECVYPWPDECSVQAGERGIVFSKSGNYKTAFFEAFPDCNGINTFIRGEGTGIVDAETQAWDKYQVAAACQHLEWDRRGYTNGLAYCIACGISDSKHFSPTTHCTICNEPCNWTTDKHGKAYCKAHEKHIKQEDKSDITLRFEKMDAELEKMDAERAERNLKRIQSQLPPYETKRA